MRGDARLSRLMPALSARERGILVLRSLKDGTPEHPEWRRSMPTRQQVEFNRYIGLMNVANIQLGHLITFMEKEVDKLELRLALWFTLSLWQLNLAEIDFFASVVAREAVTESEYRQKVVQHEGVYLPVATLATALATELRAWVDDDLEEVGWTRERLVRDESWARLTADAEREIRHVAEAGELESRGSGKALEVKAASFDAWAGCPLTLRPEWADGYEVLPDERAVQVEAQRNTLAFLRQAIADTPLSRLAPGEEGTTLSGLIEGMEVGLKQSLAVRRTDLRALDLMLGEISDRFDGEDPLRPPHRKAVERTRLALQAIASQLYAGQEVPPLEEPTAAELKEMRDHLDRGQRLFWETVG